MSKDTNTSTFPKLLSSPNYQLAREMGYELSKEQFFELYKYARMVQKEHINYPEVLDRSMKITMSMAQSNSSNYLSKTRNSYPEDLWIQYLRECFDSESRG